jgi:hypothetical protein
MAESFVILVEAVLERDSASGISGLVEGVKCKISEVHALYGGIRPWIRDMHLPVRKCWSTVEGVVRDL